MGDWFLFVPSIVPYVEGSALLINLSVARRRTSKSCWNGQTGQTLCCFLRFPRSLNHRKSEESHFDGLLIREFIVHLWNSNGADLLVEVESVFVVLGIEGDAGFA